MMPSLARIRLATATSRRNSANGSGMVVCSLLWLAKRRIANSKSRTARTVYSLFATRYSHASDLAEEVGEFFLDLARELRARARDPGKVLEPLERPAGVDDGARIGRARFVEERIERTAPGAAHEIDVNGGVAARARRPHHVEQVGRVDVVVDHDDEAPEIGCRLAAGREQAGWARMAGIGLLDGDDVEHARAA